MQALWRLASIRPLQAPRCSPTPAPVRFPRKANRGLSLSFNLSSIVFGFLFVRLMVFRRDWVAGRRAAGGAFGASRAGPAGFSDMGGGAPMPAALRRNG